MVRLARRRRSRHHISDIPLTPLIDTALTLLVIFMLTTPMLQNSIKVDLPYGKAKEAGGAQQDIVVFIDSKGTFFFNGIPYKEDGLVDQLKKTIKNSNEQVVYVKGDRNASYGTILELVDHLKVVGGIKYVALATQKTT